ncbi:hypothetical protein SCAR479_11311 [Seiridium cardinale]|uniref:Uncharacterized protein n=1 Tax=Seiridium cardinale TaxID=138064 RepID=A0ABR2XE32_9PEZI
MPSRACIVISSILPLAILAALLHYVHGASIASNEPMWDAIYGPVVAIANCRVAFSTSPYDGEPRLLESMPACVAFTDNGVVTGNDIETQVTSDPSNTICGVKSLLGRKWSDPELQSIINGLDYRVVEIDDNPMILANINGTETTMSPERVQGFLFRKMKAIAEQFLEHDVTNIFVPIEIDDLVGGLSFVGVLTPSDFVTINDAYLDLKAVRQLLDDLKLSTKDIDDVIIARGSAHIPEIQNRLEGFFERKSPLQGTSLDDAIVIGTAMQGAALSAEEPTSACLFCIDSCPLSVGVNAAGGIFKRIISRKTLLPVRRAQSFTTAVDGQSSMLIQVFEGGHIGNKTKMVMDILERDRVLDQGFEMQYDHILADAEEHADEDQVLREITIAHLQVDNAIPAPEGQTGGNAPQRDEL